MRVFIICTGRTGSHNIAKACSFIENYTSGHETRIAMSASEKLNYPDNHIEADNRLSWLLGSLDKRFEDNDTIYVHLKRDPALVAKSYNRRWHLRYSIVRAFSSGILMKNSRQDDIKSCNDYVEVVNDNIEFFLKSKSNKLTINIENIDNDFKAFWKLINAEGDLEAALKCLSEPSNKSPSKYEVNLSKVIYGFRVMLDYVWR